MCLTPVPVGHVSVLDPYFYTPCVYLWHAFLHWHVYATYVFILVCVHTYGTYSRTSVRVSVWLVFLAGKEAP